MTLCKSASGVESTLTPEMLDISRKQYLLLGGEEEEEEQEEQEEQKEKVGEEIDNGETADGTPSMSTESITKIVELIKTTILFPPSRKVCVWRPWNWRK